MESIIGQSHAVEVLRSSMKTGRLHHAYIFHGPQGVGKFTTARAFARTLLCLEQETDLAGNIAACGHCASCRLFSADGKGADNHPDFHVISKELALYSDEASVRNSVQKTIAVDVLRQFMIGGVVNDKPVPAVVGWSSQMQRGRVFIIDQAELLSDIGQNALLKTLEEPPKGVTIILITSNESKLLPTIRSRSQRLTFTPIPDERVREWVLSQPTWAGSDEDLQWLLDYAGGSIGRASLAIEYDLVSWSREVLPLLRDLARGEYPVTLGSRMSALMSGYAQEWVRRHKNASKDAANKMAAELMWYLITQQMRKAIRARASKAAVGDPESVEAHLLPYARAIESIDTVERELQGNVSISFVCDHAVSLLARSLVPTARGSA